MREKSVSAGWGPPRSRPSLRRRSSTGSMTSISSRPWWPDSPAWGLRPATAMRGRVMPTLLCRAARSRSTSTAPRTDSRHGRGCCDRAMHRSGPIPAGAPAVRARWGKSTASSRNPGRSVDRADFDIGRVADLAHPVLEGLIALAFADGLARQQFLTFLRDVLIASLKDLDQVPAERGLNGVADLAGLQRVHGFLEFGDGVARIDPAKVAAFGSTGILGLQTRHVLEFRAVFDTFLELQQAVAGVGFRGEFVGLDEDVARQA